MSDSANVSSLPITVLGSGAWGTALASAAADANPNARIIQWTREPEIAAEINTLHENKTLLPGIKLPENISATPDIRHALESAGIVVIVIPTQFMRKTLESCVAAIPPSAVVCSASKGVEMTSLKPISGILDEVLPGNLADRACYISGPTFAREVAKKLPAAATIASKDPESAEAVRKALATDYFRLYLHDDIIGVEFCGAVKNVIAIAVGIADGMELGLNARAAIITRGLAETARLARKFGANPVTIAGLAGVGDMVLTCTGDLSRNRTVGLRLGRGETIDQILAGSKAVAEGVETAVALKKLMDREGLDMPISREVYSILHEGKKPAEAIITLMTRPAKSEF